MLVHESTYNRDCNELPETVNVVIICHSDFFSSTFSWLIVKPVAFPMHHINHLLQQ